jgi:hypothetical protein
MSKCRKVDHCTPVSQDSMTKNFKPDYCQHYASSSARLLPSAQTVSSPLNAMRSLTGISATLPKPLLGNVPTNRVFLLCVLCVRIRRATPSTMQVSCHMANDKEPASQPNSHNWVLVPPVSSCVLVLLTPLAGSLREARRGFKIPGATPRGTPTATRKLLANSSSNYSYLPSTHTS